MSKTEAPKKKEERMYFRQLYSDEAQKSLLQWWLSLDNASGARAQLRRCASPDEAVLHPQTYRVMQILPWISGEAAATVAGILPHIKIGSQGNNTPFGKKLASPILKGGPAPFSETRFRQLLSSRTWDDLYRNLRRAIQVLKGDVNPLFVADLILCWDKENQGKERLVPGKSLKFWLSQDYYRHAPKQKK